MILGQTTFPWEAEGMNPEFLLRSVGVRAFGRTTGDLVEGVGWLAGRYKVTPELVHQWHAAGRPLNV